MSLDKVLLLLNDCNVKLSDMFGNTIYPIMSVGDLTSKILDSSVMDDVLSTRVNKIVPVEFKYPDSDFCIAYMDINLNVRGI